MNGRWIVCYAAILHLAWAVILFAFPPVRTTALDLLVHLFGNFAPVTGLVLVVSIACALAGLRLRNRPVLSFALLLPQQYLVIVSAVGALGAMLAGHFADGIVRPSEFIIADQAPAVLLALMHAAALLERYAWRPRVMVKAARVE
jgi:hypothetical protein